MSPDKTNIYPTLTPTRSDVVVAARDWLGTRWVHQGRSKGGIDCAGLVIRVHQQLGLPVEDMQGYRRAPDGHLFLEHIRRQTTFAPEPRPGSLGIFRQDRFACHVGFFGWSDAYQMITLIHAHAAHKKVVEEPFTKEWVPALVETRNLIGLQD